MIELKKAPQDIRREIHGVPVGGTELALHLWRPKNVKGAVFYFHGLQSHAGWLWEVGPQFAANDIAFFTLDRRGCGISGGERSELADADSVLGDYLAALRTVREMIGDDIPLNLFGHCLGGSFLAALLHDERLDVRYDSAVFCSTWLGRLHSTLSADQRRTLAAEQRTDLWDAGLQSADFTDHPKYREYIDQDDLATRYLTLRSRRTLLELEDRYLNSSRVLPGVPTAYVSGLVDPVIDLASARHAFNELVDGRGSLLQFPTDKHYLFYTDVRAELVNWASAFTMIPALQHHG
ncbi:alpha-beta hydrolase superfamily lysophospholipase [Kitasatospora sp. MAP12-15]|uniref:alpha/beta fold hydrolase n=1 Tax=unclassified Kitasatospora TaxID=2633591 RepID=UPI0024744713|nr:alpha/beta fold hydrolase [Kitasatospora sp. MAP12-44]MDH6112522.1 alpha-beta hydrolase superfamily lysophospholipase [Kitasatospora sp. MAP12-44]